MARRDLLSQPAFNSGELGPLMAARQDQARYGYGLKRMRNFIPSLQGPARKRPGFRFVCEVANSAERAWAVPFVHDQRDAWALEFAGQTVRFHTDDGQVVEATRTITAATTAAQAVFTSNAHGYANGDEVVAAGMTGFLDTNSVSIFNGRNFKISDITANTYKLKDLYGTYLSSAAATAYSSGGTTARVYKIASPWTIANLTQSVTNCLLLSFAQSGDVLDICVPSFQPRQLTRTASTSWAFSTFEPAGGPFETVDPDQTITVYSSAATGTGVTLTASSAIFSASHVGSLFLLEMKLTDTVTAWETAKVVAAGQQRRSQGHYYYTAAGGTTGTITPNHTEGSRYDGDTGVLWEYRHSGYGWLKITGFTSSTVVTADVVSRIPDQAVLVANASTRWAFGSWNNVDGWPTHVCYFRERKCFARDTRIWGSVPSDFGNFAQRDSGVVASDSAFDIDIRSGVNDEIQWLVPLADLLVGTEGNEFSVGEISSSDPLGPDNIAALAGPGYGTRRTTPCIINDAVMYALPSGRTVREMRFTFETDGYSSFNRTAFAEHIAKGQVIQFAYQREPESIMWAVCDNGDLIAMSYEREHDLLAWHKHPLGGDALAESVCVIPSPTGDRDEVWIIAKLTVNGQTKRYWAYLDDHWDPDTDAAADQFYVDFGLTYSGAAASRISGLHHLEAKSVRVFGDGRDLGSFTVSGGQISLGSTTVTKAQIGLTYTATLESMNLVRPGYLARIVFGWAKFISTISAAWSTITQRDRSTETGASREIEFDNISVSAAALPVSRLIKAAGESGLGRELSWVLTHDKPSYCNVASVTHEMLSEAQE